MADLDYFYDTRGIICNFIEEKIRELFNTTMNKFNFPPWIQATMLFYEVVVPCEYTPTEELVELGELLVKESEKHGCKAYFYGEKNGKKELCYIEDVTKKVEKIKKWIEESKEYF